MSKATILFATTAVVSSMAEASSDVTVRRNLRGSGKPSCLRQLQQSGFPDDLRGICRVQLEAFLADCNQGDTSPFNTEQTLTDCYQTWQISYDESESKELFSVENLEKIIRGYKSVTTESSNPCDASHCRGHDDDCKAALEPLTTIYDLWPNPACTSAKQQMKDFCTHMIDGPDGESRDDYFQQAYNTTQYVIPFSLAGCAYQTTAFPAAEHLDHTLQALQKVSRRVEMQWKKADQKKTVESDVLAIKLGVAQNVTNVVGNAMQDKRNSAEDSEEEDSMMYYFGQNFDAAGCDEQCQHNLKYYLRITEIFVTKTVKEPLQHIIAGIPTLQPYLNPDTGSTEGPSTWYKAITEARRDADAALHCVQTAGMLAMPLEQEKTLARLDIVESHLHHHRGGNQCRFDREHGLVAKHFEAVANLMNSSPVGNVYTGLTYAIDILNQPRVTSESDDSESDDSESDKTTFRSLNSVEELSQE